MGSRVAQVAKAFKVNWRQWNAGESEQSSMSVILLISWNSKDKILVLKTSTIVRR